MAVKKNEAAETSFWEERVPVMIPLNPMSPEDQTEFVSVGDYTAQIQRGVEVMIPRKVAKVLEQSQKAEYDAMMNRINLQRQYEADMRNL